MTQLNLLKYCKASLPLPQVVLPCPDGPLSHEVPSTAISAANKEQESDMSKLHAIVALTANGSYAFPQFFVLASEYIFHLLLETTIDIPHVWMIIARSLPVCDEVALHWLPLRLHKNCSVTKLLRKFFLRNFCLTEFIEIYKNLTLRKYSAIRYKTKLLKHGKAGQLYKKYPPIV